MKLSDYWFASENYKKEIIQESCYANLETDNMAMTIIGKLHHDPWLLLANSDEAEPCLFISVEYAN